MQKNNVIDLKAKRAAKSQNRSGSKNSDSEIGISEHLVAPILDMTERRNEMIQQERRKVKRTILSEFIGACIVIPQRGLLKVSLYDVSSTGMSFDLESKFGQIASGEEVAIRMYLNKQTYFPFVIKIAHTQLMDTESVYRYGCKFVGGTINNEALSHFVKFIETVSASLRTDHGDVMVSNIGR